MRILIADDHELVRDTIAAFLAGEGLGEAEVASTLAEALARIARQDAGFDLVLLDYDMPGMAGLQGLREVLAAAAGRPVALISGAAPPGVAEAAIAAGAAGFVPKTLAPAGLVAAIRQMAAGSVFRPEPAPVGAERRDFGLSSREMDVLRGICAGKSNKEIARDFDLQEVTVKLHVKTMSRKLGAKNRTHAAMIARDRRLF